MNILAKPPPQDQLPEDFRREIAAGYGSLNSYKQKLTELLADMIVLAGIWKR